MAAKKRRKKASKTATKPVVHHKRRKKTTKKTLGSLGHASTKGAVKLQLANVIKTLETIKREV